LTSRLSTSTTPAARLDGGGADRADFRPMDRSGIASGTRAIAMRIWKGKLPNRPPEDLARELYETENKGKAEPSGSQDMIGLVYPGVNRLDYDFKIHGGVFPSHIESCNSAKVARWLSKVLHLIPVEPRPDGYSPLGIKNLSPKWVARSASRARIATTPLSKWTRKRSARHST
jgi:hypothetical protein